MTKTTSGVNAITGEIVKINGVHPVANLFPMLADDEQAELAADIAARGLLQPIVLDKAGRILDGRNRLAACRLAGVEPVFVTYEGDDPDGYALAVNIARRHLTKGQIAMVAAQAAAVTETVTGRSLAQATGISEQRVSYAKTVLDHASELADLVVSGAKSLDEAYKIARQRKQDADSEEGRLLRLQCDAPDLAAKVVEGDLALNDAVAALDERQRKRADEQRDARALLTRIVDLTTPESRGNGWLDSWADRIGDVDVALIARTEQAGQILLDLAERIKQ